VLSFNLCDLRFVIFRLDLSRSRNVRSEAKGLARSVFHPVNPEIRHKTLIVMQLPPGEHPFTYVRHGCLATFAKAAVLESFGQPLVLKDFPVPESIAPGETLVRVEIAGICGTDVHLWLGQLPIPIPVILGHESVGRIERMGAGLANDWRGNPLQVGDRVTWASSITCGECFYCRMKKQPTRCLSRKAYGISYRSTEAPHLRGGYAELILLRAGSSIFRLPDDLPGLAVVGAGCALTTAIHGIERAPVTWGDTVVIQGAGPVGLAALAVSRESGAARTIVIGGPKHRLELARSFGADATIDIAEFPDIAKRREAVLSETGPYGADVVIECVGHPDAVNEGIDLCRDGANFLVLGQYADAGNISFNPHAVTRKQLRMIGSWGFEPRHVDAAISLLGRHGWKEKFASEITHRYPLAEANAALQTVREWRGGKTVILPNRSSV
jgi:threonine dehydrogenase-like Zn-dependent dehydrogenase